MVVGERGGTPLGMLLGAGVEEMEGIGGTIAGEDLAEEESGKEGEGEAGKEEEEGDFIFLFLLGGFAFPFKSSMVTTI